MERRVVITAGASITPIGDTREQILQNLENGVSGVKPMREDELLTGLIRCGVFGTVDYDIEFNFERHYRKTMGPVSYYACKVAKEVVEQAGLEPDFLSSGRMGVAFGSTHGSPSVQRGIYKALMASAEANLSKIGAADYLRSMVHTTAVNITRYLGITGRIISSCTACTTSSQSLGYGYESVKYGMQDAMICGGADEYDMTTVGVFDNLRATSTAFNDTPHLTPRPFDQKRDGMVVAEGAGALLLEEYEFAKSRGADILAEVVGFACSNNGGDLILPVVDGIVPTIRAALQSAGLGPEEVDFISAHATATRMGDVVEAQAIHSIYGDRPRVTGLKSYIGHTMGSCGAIETLMTLYMMQEGRIFPTLNLDQVDPRCGMINLVREAQDQDIRVATVQNFAFGGVNTCLLLKKFE